MKSLFKAPLHYKSIENVQRMESTGRIGFSTLYPCYIKIAIVLFIVDFLSTKCLILVSAWISLF